MPHSTERNQITFDYSIEVNNTGNAVWNNEQEVVDPRGEYAVTARASTEDTDGNGDRWSIQNDGPDLRIAGVHIGLSQGSENGRAWWNVGWDVYAEKYAAETILDDFGVEGESPYSRVSKEFYFPEDIRPLWETNDTLQLSCIVDTAGTGDSSKAGCAVHVVPAHDTENSQNRL